MRSVLSVVAVLAWLLVPAVAAAADVSAGPGAALAPAPAGSAEARLRRIETAELGAGHAAMHAYQRQLGAQARSAPVARVAPPVLPPLGPPDVGGRWAA